jgi:tRNA-dihydrouridine synthase B
MSFGSLHIDSLVVDPNLILAPMSGISGSAFRRLIKAENPGAVGLVVSEFISVEALSRRNRRSLNMCRWTPEERPISVQLFGYDVGRMVESAEIVQESGADIVDINCGCPVPKVVKRGGGCELMRQRDHLARILSEVKKVLHIPLTIKIRSGWDEATNNAVEIARMAEECGVSMITVHGRTCKQLYKGAVNWDIIANLASSVSVPVVASGDICSVESAFTAWKTGVAGLMIGRGALANPWIFSKIAEACRGCEHRLPGDLAVVGVIDRYLDLLLEELPEKAVIGRIKQFISYVTRRVAGSASVRRNLVCVKSIAELRSQLLCWAEQLRGCSECVEIQAAQNQCPSEVRNA